MKATKAEAQYIPYATGKRECRGCDNFSGISSDRGMCERVEGMVMARGYCKYWEKAKASVKKLPMEA